VLPSSSVDWVTALQSLRSNYCFLQEKFHIDQKMKDLSLDPAINNPLSQEQDSPWNQHFQDGEMRKMIKQDVVRTFPEVDFFQTHLVRETLVNILFVYARCHPEIGYRQVEFDSVEFVDIYVLFYLRECMSCWPLCTLW
jgi:TBC1 domain family protein 5